MHPAGLAAFAKRREDRSGVYAYETRDREWSADYEAVLRADATASAFWDAATPSYRKLATNWVLTAKQEATRDKRMAQLVDDCANLRLITSQRYGTEPAWVRRARSELSELRLTAAGQRLLFGGTISMWSFAADLACLSARFSLSDLAFVVMWDFGDLSPMASSSRWKPERLHGSVCALDADWPVIASRSPDAPA